MIKEKKQKRTKQHHLMNWTRRSMKLNLQNTNENHRINEIKSEKNRLVKRSDMSMKFVANELSLRVWLCFLIPLLVLSLIIQ